ncbi:MAG TPA: ATP-binding protein [Phycisphaerales bacterium]|nr:ATP-binding protein [Phycisphaerales bacterium]HMP36081.1 ATP-binding protein [Phycisphaerales bacterium]
MERRHTLRDDRDQIEAAVAELLDALRGLEFDESSRFAIRLAVEEAINNGFRHGNKNDPEKRVHFAWNASPHRVQVEVEDEGEGFDPASVPDPTAEENLEIPSGRGLMLMRAYMSQVEYVDPGNRVRMAFDR